MNRSLPVGSAVPNQKKSSPRSPLPASPITFVSDPPMCLPPSAPVDWSKPELRGSEGHSGAMTFPSWSAASLKPRCSQGAIPRTRGWPTARGGHGHRPRSISGTRSIRISEQTRIRSRIGRATRHHALRPPPSRGRHICGSGQIPFEAARLGCDVYASDLNPVACMLTWGAFHIVGGSAENASSCARSAGAR